MKKEILWALLLLFFLFIQPLSVPGTENTYQEQLRRYQNIKNLNEVASFRFTILKEQVFEVNFENFGQVLFVPARDELYNRIIIFLADNSGKIIYRTDKIESNAWKNSDPVSKDLPRINDSIVAVSFQDVNGNGLKDIILVCRVENYSGAPQSGVYTDGSFKVGDVLFQSSDGFYSNSRISEAINNFSMNQNIETIAAFAGGKQSKEFLYTSKTLAELTSKGFYILPEHSFWTEFEAFGRARVVPGIYAMGDLRTLMLYIFDSAGNICARIDSMRGYDDCLGLKGIAFEDIDGDGLRDIVVLAEYRICDENGFSAPKTDFYIGFQKDYWFERNLTFERKFYLENPAILYEVILEAKKYF